MDRDLDNMNERELLAELVQQGRRAEKAEKIKTCVLAALLLVIIVLTLVFIPKILAPLQQLSARMDQIEASFSEAERVLGFFDEKTIDQFKQTMESLNETSQQIRVLTDKLRDSGLDKLQSTIEGLNNSLGSILKFFNRG